MSERVVAWDSNKSGEYVTTSCGNKEPEYTGQDEFKSLMSNDNSKVAGRVSKEYREQEFNTLNGSLSLTIGYDSHNLNVGDVISLYGLSKALSGNYYITGIRREISDSGYGIELSVTKTTFMEQMNTPTEKQTDRPKEVKKDLTGDEAK